ncbi:MAG: hypothetical protein WCB90_14295 [Methanosarcina sp.]
MKFHDLIKYIMLTESLENLSGNGSRTSIRNLTGYPDTSCKDILEEPAKSMV